ncbi:DUF202 domain-containing protein [Mycolicibacterium moriokaense]|nr:DUF202 domain-containing protein [Mycolicibacterium moriokaense]
MRDRWPPVNSVGEDPDYRFSLANERTFLAWIRTALALLAGGVAAGSYQRWGANERAVRLGRSLQPSLIPRLLAAGLTPVALVALLLVIVSG